MKFDVFSRIPVVASRALATLVVLTGLGLATPSAFANIPLSWSATDLSGGSASGTATGVLGVTNQTVGGFSLSITSNTTDPAGGSGTTTASYSSLSTTTFTISNHGSTATLDLLVTGTNFSVASSDRAGFSVSGSSSAYGPADTTTATSSINGTAIPGGGMVGIAPPNGLTTTYTWTPNSNSGTLSFTNSSTFSIAQALAITLGAGDSATLTINTTVVAAAVPEPSTMAIAGLGALGMIGYGLRRRKALGA